jgi:transposase
MRRCATCWRLWPSGGSHCMKKPRHTRADRIKSEAVFAKMCGACPIPAGSGKTNSRHRLYRGGNRQANAALYRVVIVRLRWHQPTIDYVARRTAEGLSKREIIRCLKRYLAQRALDAVMVHDM